MTVLGLEAWRGGGESPPAEETSVARNDAFSRQIPGAPLPRVELVANTGAYWSAPGEAVRRASSEARLNMFLSQHIESSPTAEREGMLPYSRLVGYDERAAGVAERWRPRPTGSGPPPGSRCAARPSALARWHLCSAPGRTRAGRGGARGRCRRRERRPRARAGETPPDPAELVAAMSRALRTLNYEGTFVHLQGTHASSMRILHANDGEGELERMTSLDGEAREVIRDRSLVTCIWPGSRSVVVSKSRPRQLLPDVDEALASNDRYELHHAGVDRVAAVETDVVEVRPRDRYRYGYRFWIDRQTRMLLRSMLLDGGRVVEQVLFTAIAYPDAIDRSRFEIDVASAGGRVSWIEGEPAFGRTDEGGPDGGRQGGRSGSWPNARRARTGRS